MQREQWSDVIFFTGLDNRPLADGIWAKLKEYFGEEPHTEHINYGRFSDSEIGDKFADPEKLRDKTIVFFECFRNLETVMRFLQLCWAAKNQYGAKHIIAIISFLHYRRQDHPEKFYEIQRNYWICEQLKHNGVDFLITATPHSDQTRANCEKVGLGFRAVDLSEGFASVSRPLLPENGDAQKACVFAPDEGSIPRAIALARYLNIDVLFNLKLRGTNNEVTLVEDEARIEEVRAKYNCDFLKHATPERIAGVIVIMIDDEVTTGNTSNKQAKRLLQCGVAKIILLVSHPVCVSEWKEKLMDGNPFAKIIMFNTILRTTEQRTGGKIHDVSAAGLMASAVYRVLQQRFGGD